MAGRTSNNRGGLRRPWRWAESHIECLAQIFAFKQISEPGEPVRESPGSQTLDEGLVGEGGNRNCVVARTWRSAVELNIEAESGVDVGIRT